MQDLKTIFAVAHFFHEENPLGNKHYLCIPLLLENYQEDGLSRKNIDGILAHIIPEFHYRESIISTVLTQSFFEKDTMGKYILTSTGQSLFVKYMNSKTDFIRSWDQICTQLYYFKEKNDPENNINWQHADISKHLLIFFLNIYKKGMPTLVYPPLFEKFKVEQSNYEADLIFRFIDNLSIVDKNLESLFTVLIRGISIFLSFSNRFKLNKEDRFPKIYIDNMLLSYLLGWGSPTSNIPYAYGILENFKSLDLTINTDEPTLETLCSTIEIYKQKKNKRDQRINYRSFYRFMSPSNAIHGSYYIDPMRILNTSQLAEEVKKVGVNITHMPPYHPNQIDKNAPLWREIEKSRRAMMEKRGEDSQTEYITNYYYTVIDRFGKISASSSGINLSEYSSVFITDSYNLIKVYQKSKSLGSKKTWMPIMHIKNFLTMLLFSNVIDSNNAIALNFTKSLFFEAYQDHFIPREIQNILESTEISEESKSYIIALQNSPIGREAIRENEKTLKDPRTNISIELLEEYMKRAEKSLQTVFENIIKDPEIKETEINQAPILTNILSEKTPQETLQKESVIWYQKIFDDPIFLWIIRVLIILFVILIFGTVFLYLTGNSHIISVINNLLLIWKK